VDFEKRKVHCAQKLCSLILGCSSLNEMTGSINADFLKKSLAVALEKIKAR